MNSTCHLYKYADDMVVVGLMQVGNTANQSVYFNCIEELTTWCNDSALFINESKTKEMVIRTQKNCCHDLIPVVINGQHVEEVEDFKYLGTYFDSTLFFLLFYFFLKFY